MAEPARKLSDIEPDIRPTLGVIQGGGNSIPGRTSLKMLENQESNPEETKSGSIEDQESNGSYVIRGPWENNVSGNNNAQLKSSGRLNSLKKKGPLTAIILTLVGGGIGIGGLLSPGLLIVNLKEIMINKFDSQLASMTVRSSKILTSKMGTTKGILCNTVLNIGCKYSSMSAKQMSNFEEAGIKVNYEDTTVLGRSKPTSFEFNGNTIQANEFSTEINSNPEFRAAINKAYNPKFAGFVDNIWEKAASKLGISKKAANLDGETDEAKLKSIQEDTRNPATDETISTPKEASLKDENPDGSPKYKDQAAVDAANKAIKDSANDTAAIESAATAAEKDATKASTEVLEAVDGAAKGSLSTIANTLKITGFADSACTAYGAIQAVGYAAKTVRALQLARYAMIFLNVADQIKAGVAKPEDVSYLGKILTTEVAATATTPKLGSATDSFGYKYAAYGSGGAMSTTASQFLAGGGLAGSLISVTSSINTILKGTPRQTCGILKNPFVSGASLIGGVAIMLVPGVDVAFAAKDVLQAAAAIAFNLAASAAPALLQDIVAGLLVDKTTVGEAAGDAITSGASGIMSTTAANGGNAPLTPDQAVAYNDLSNKIANQYAEEDRLSYSPLDPTNSNTFMGKIVAQLIPYASKMSSISGALTSIASLSINSFASITTQNTKATSTEDYTQCQDFDYRNMNLATDPYCNVMYGIPASALNDDPIAVANSLSGQVDEITGAAIPGSNYDKFLSSCINRNLPLGSVSDSFQESDGSECLFNSTNKNYYLYFIDQRVNNGMEQ